MIITYFFELTGIMIILNALIIELLAERGLKKELQKSKIFLNQK